MSSRSFSNQAFASVLRDSMTEMSMCDSEVSSSLRAKRSNPSGGKEVWIASSLTLLAMTVKVTLTLRSEIGAALVAAVAMDADAGQRAALLQALPDEARQVFQ